MITPMQITCGRTLAGLTQSELGDIVGLHQKTISNVEQGESCTASTLSKIKNALEARGIIFSPPEGVNRRTDSVITLKGKSGFHTFLDDVYNTVKNGGFINVANVDDKSFLKWASEKHEPHMERMEAIENLICRSLLVEGASYKATEYSQYRSLPKEVCGPVPFYLYSHKLALIQFDQEPTIFIIDSPAISQTYQAQFEAMWESAR